jgi:hypothetical protein
MPQVDHIFPQSAFKKVKALNPKTNKRDLTRYKDAERNQLANCMLLTQKENGAGGKSDTLPEVWFAKRVAEEKNYLDMHLVPKDPELWKLDRFEDFISERKKIIRQQYAYLFSSATRSPADGQ